MHRIILGLAIIALVAGAAVHAQIGKPIPEKPYDIVVQDDNTGAYLLISSRTGAYEFVRCTDNLEMYGTGSIKIDGCDITLADSQENHLVVASINLCSQTGTAAIDVYKATKAYPAFPPMSERLFDKDMRDSTWLCNSELYNTSVESKIEPPEFLIIQNDTDGSFLYFEPLNGHYKFVHCEDGTTLSGIAKLTVDGCSISLEDITPNRVVVASVDICAMEGKAAIQTIPTAEQLEKGLDGMEEFIDDRNLTDNTSQCGPKDVK